jgi:predicted aldo/keto reductase-like oxidoreductase
MEPIRGGQLARRPPEAVAAHWAAANAAREARDLAQRTPAEWALHWVWDHPEVSTVLSGMSTMEQVEQNVAAASSSRPGSLTPDERTAFTAVAEAFRGLTPIPCTACKYCMPCPNGVDIPTVFEYFNDRFLYDHLEMARMYYSWLEECEQADKCIRCGECEPKCPQKIEIMDWLEKAHVLLRAEVREPEA